VQHRWMRCPSVVENLGLSTGGLSGLFSIQRCMEDFFPGQIDTHHAGAYAEGGVKPYWGMSLEMPRHISQGDADFKASPLRGSRMRPE